MVSRLLRGCSLCAGPSAHRMKYWRNDPGHQVLPIQRLETS